MNCYETLFSMTVVAVAPYAIEAVSPWIRRAVKRVIGARAPI